MQTDKHDEANGSFTQFCKHAKKSFLKLQCMFFCMGTLVITHYQVICLAKNDNYKYTNISMTLKCDIINSKQFNFQAKALDYQDIQL
jgi:hypothetical protein